MTVQATMNRMDQRMSRCESETEEDRTSSLWWGLAGIVAERWWGSRLCGLGSVTIGWPSSSSWGRDVYSPRV